MSQAELFGSANVASGRYLEASAIVSDCGVYRYQLERRWSDGQTVLWLMLNPSTADSRQDDRTIGRCVDFSRRWGFGGLLIGNLYALRATDPDELVRHASPLGPRNLWNIVLMAARASRVIAAWGAHPFVQPSHVGSVLDNVAALHPKVWCLGRTKRGAPRHPLYVPRIAGLEEFQP